MSVCSAFWPYIAVCMFIQKHKLKFCTILFNNINNCSIFTFVMAFHIAARSKPGTGSLPTIHVHFCISRKLKGSKTSKILEKQTKSFIHLFWFCQVLVESISSYSAVIQQFCHSILGLVTFEI